MLNIRTCLLIYKKVMINLEGGQRERTVWDLDDIISRVIHFLRSIVLKRISFFMYKAQKI